MERERLSQSDNPRRRLPGRPARRRGFTLLEILTVIGIILLLVAIGVIAFGALDQSGRATKTTLANLQAMLSEFETTTALKDKPTQIFANNRAVPLNQPNQGPELLWKNAAIATPAAGLNGPVSSGSAARYQWDAVANTQIVLGYLTRLPQNKQVMSRLPGKQVHGVADGTTKGTKLSPQPASGANAKVIDPPLILDAWNNPIVYVGRDGLRGVKYEARKNGTTFQLQTVTSAGPFQQDPTATNSDNLPTNRRPFFASAGQDGDFTTGDDNVYSFEQ